MTFLPESTSSIDGEIKDFSYFSFSNLTFLRNSLIISGSGDSLGTTSTNFSPIFGFSAIFFNSCFVVAKINS
jgi:hypothetical protein